MATITADVGGGNWTTGSTWVGGTAPTAADDVLLISTSGSITIDSGAVCRSLNATGYTGTLTHTAGVTLTIGDATAGLSNVALLLVSGMTYTLGSATTSAISFISTSATQQTIAAGGKTLGNWTINGAGSSYLLSDANTIGSGSTVTLTAGTLDTNGQTCSWGIFSSTNSNTRTLTLGASAITITGASTTVWNCATSTNLTLNANTSSITFSGATVTFRGGTNTYNTIIFSGSGTATCNESFTVATLTRTGTAVKTDTFDIIASFTVTSALNLNGNSATNRIIVRSSVIGTAITITNTGVTPSASNVDFRDITFSASFDASAITGLSGDCGGNSGITFTTAADQHWTSASGGNWSTSSNWTSRVPLPQDDVYFDNAFSASQTVTLDMPRSGKTIDWTGATGTPEFSISGGAATIYGGVTLISAMILSGTSSFTFEGRGSFNLTSAGNTFLDSVFIAMVGGTLTLSDALSVSGNGSSTGLFTVNNGTFTTNNFNITCVGFISRNSGVTRAINLGSSVLTSTGTGGNTWRLDLPSGLTLNAGTSTIIFSDTSATDKNFQGGGLTYHKFQITGGGSGAIIITGANTFNRITVTGGTKSITLPGSTTTTIVSGKGLKNNTNVVTFTASAGSATISKSSGILDWNYVSLTNIPASGNAKFYAGANSTDGGGNTNWVFRNAPSGSGQFADGNLGRGKFGRGRFGTAAFFR